MNKIWNKVLLFIISIALGVIFMTQYNTVQNVLGTDKSINDKTSDLNDEMTKLNIERNQLRDELDRLKSEAEVNTAIIKDREEEIQRIEEELNKHKILSGYYDVKGKGVIITIDASPNSYINLAYSHQYILALISYLNNAGVEAISINGQRYTNYTEIVPVLDHINVNSVALVLPLEIKAIGNDRTIEASLNFVGGIVSQMSQIGFVIETEYKDEIHINKFVGEKEFLYATPIEPTDEEELQ